MTSTTRRAEPFDQHNDRLEFESFYRTTWPRLLDTAGRMAGFDNDLAQEATQQAYVEMLRRWPQRRMHSLDDNRRYTVAIIGNKIADHFRYRRRLRPFDDDWDDASSDSVDAEPLPEYLALLRQIDKQPAQRRAVVILYFFEDLTPNQIAASIKISPSTVRTQLQRARADLTPYAEKLRDALKDGSYS
jgi:RNA polymerase sigma factor (sigma-70 family)